MEAGEKRRWEPGGEKTILAADILAGDKAESEQ
jgi:hypothetical protein